MRYNATSGAYIYYHLRAITKQQTTFTICNMTREITQTLLYLEH